MRAELLRRLRAFFDERGLLEVETPLLSAETVIDRHLEPLSVELEGRTCWLQTSPEAAMKRLLAAGAPPIYQVTRSLRSGERGALHNPEFTIVEWYRTGDDLEAGMALCEELADALLGCGPAERTPYATAFEQALGTDPHRASAADLCDAARRAGLAPEGWDASTEREAWLDLLLAAAVEPALGRGRPTLLYDYPESGAALARLHGDPPRAARFELYLEGTELANGYHELCDAAELALRFERTATARRAAGRRPLPGAPRLLQAMEHGLPDCCGVALGFDRVVMLAVGATRIDEVLAFPIERA